MKLPRLVLAAAACGALWGQGVETVAVVSKQLDRKLRLPGELAAYQKVSVRARVAGFVDTVKVDRGSVVKKGDVLAVLSAPEMAAQIASAEAKVAAATAAKAEAEAKRAAAQATHERLKKAAATPGVVAGNDLVQAAQAVEAASAAVASQEAAIKALGASVAALKDLQAYLEITAPFAGVITERKAHPGMLAGPSADALFELEEVSRLRLIAPVPESDIGGIVRGAAVTFSVPAFPGETFRGVITRVARSLDAKSRTMPVELDVDNASLRLAPGMFADLQWPVRKARASLLVPPTAVVTNTERVFVVRVRDGKAEWVPVAKGAPAGDLVEVMGALAAGDVVVKRASDEIREGTKIGR